MAEYRTILTRIWDDPWFCALEDDDAKLFWIYLFSNSRASVAGIYLLRDKVAAAESGLSIERVKALFDLFARDGKAMREGDVVWVKKMRSIQETQSPQVQKRIAKDVSIIPNCEVLIEYKKHYGYPIDTVSTPCQYPDQKIEPVTVTGTVTDTVTEDDTVASAPTSSSSLFDLMLSHPIATAYRKICLNGGHVPKSDSKTALDQFKLMQALEEYPRLSTDVEFINKTVTWYMSNRVKGRPSFTHCLSCIIGRIGDWKEAAA